MPEPSPRSHNPYESPQHATTIESWRHSWPRTALAALQIFSGFFLGFFAPLLYRIAQHAWANRLPAWVANVLDDYIHPGLLIGAGIGGIAIILTARIDPLIRFAFAVVFGVGVVPWLLLNLIY
jgi:hypothetical protein